MGAPPRPSDVFRLPEDPPTPPDHRQEPSPPSRSIPTWAAVAALMLFGGVLAAFGATGADSGGTVAPTVDIVSEDHAIRALALYRQEYEGKQRLLQRREIYADGGPAEARQRAASAQLGVRKALRAAQRQVGADPLAAIYWNDGGHAMYADRLAEVESLASTIHLLTTTHETLYGGAGLIAPDEAHAQIVSFLYGGARGSRTGPLNAWGSALLDELEGRERVVQAVRARAGAQQQWAAAVEDLAVPSVSSLRAYVQGLPPGMVEALKGHPVAGPAVRTLERS